MKMIIHKSNEPDFGGKIIYDIYPNLCMIFKFHNIIASEKTHVLFFGNNNKNMNFKINLRYRFYCQIRLCYDR